MSQYLNGDGKGNFFSNSENRPTKQILRNPLFKITNNPVSWKWSKDKSDTQLSADDTLRQMILHFEKDVFGCLMMKEDSMLRLIDRTNNRIYDALYVTQSRWRERK